MPPGVYKRTEKHKKMNAKVFTNKSIDNIDPKQALINKIKAGKRRIDLKKLASESKIKLNEVLTYIIMLGERIFSSESYKFYTHPLIAKAYDPSAEIGRFSPVPYSSSFLDSPLILPKAKNRTNIVEHRRSILRPKTRSNSLRGDIHINELISGSYSGKSKVSEPRQKKEIEKKEIERFKYKKSKPGGIPETSGYGSQHPMYHIGKYRQIKDFLINSYQKPAELIPSYIKRDIKLPLKTRIGKSLLKIKGAKLSELYKFMIDVSASPGGSSSATQEAYNRLGHFKRRLKTIKPNISKSEEDKAGDEYFNRVHKQLQRGETPAMFAEKRTKIKTLINSKKERDRLLNKGLVAGALIGGLGGAALGYKSSPELLGKSYRVSNTIMSGLTGASAGSFIGSRMAGNLLRRRRKD